MILIDIGNSTYHILDGDLDYKLSVNDDLPKFVISKKIYFISVNLKATTKLTTTYPQAINIKHYFNFATKFATTMGIDRVAVCSCIDDAIIVDCGTAITVDIMQNSNHKGGFILPGFDKLKQIYPDISLKLNFNFENNINLDKIPLNTNDAINYAIMQMIILPIKDVQDKYRLNIVFTGEQSVLIQNHFIKSEFRPKLIFEAMKNTIKGYK
jgi:type III pantothenate kinase